MADTNCSVKECVRTIFNKKHGLCEAHNLQRSRGKPFTPLPEYVQRRPREKCSFTGCDNDRKSLGLCIRHYNQTRGPLGLRPLGPEKVPGDRRDKNGNKHCSKCLTWKPESDFQKSKGRPDGLQHMCRTCKAANYRSNAEEVRDKMREQRLGITRSEFDMIFESQDGKCAICRSTDPGSSFWHTDHDHACCDEPGRSCGQCIRGILCSRCNSSLGMMHEDVASLNRMIGYINEWHPRREAWKTNDL